MVHINEFYRNRYEAHNAHVMQYCPAEDLLVINIKEGWAPLCKFLKIPPIAGALPHLNQSGSRDETQQYVSVIMADFTWRCKKEIIFSLVMLFIVLPIVTAVLVTVLS